MDGIHDLGGKLGFGPVEVSTEDPPFKAAWEARMYAIVRAISRPADWNIDKLRHSRELEDPVRYLTRPYYDQWYAAQACMLVGSGLVTIEELVSGEARGDGPTGLPAPMTREQVKIARFDAPSFEHPHARAPRFRPGDTVRACLTTPTGHCRLPAYVRGHRGCIIRDNGSHHFADVAAHDEIVHTPLYTVRFQIRDLFPEREGSTDRVHLDLWEQHLEADS